MTCSDEQFHARLLRLIGRVTSKNQVLGVTYRPQDRDTTHRIVASNFVPPGEVNPAPDLNVRSGDTMTVSIEIAVRPEQTDQEIAAAMLLGAMWLRCHEVQEQFRLDDELVFWPHRVGNVFSGLAYAIGDGPTWNTTDLGDTAHEVFRLLDAKYLARAQAQ